MIIKFLPEEIERIIASPEFVLFVRDISRRMHLFDNKLQIICLVNKKNIESQLLDISFALYLQEKIEGKFKGKFQLFPQLVKQNCPNAFLLLSLDFRGDYDESLGRLEILWQTSGAELKIINNSNHFGGHEIEKYKSLYELYH